MDDFTGIRTRNTSKVVGGVGPNSLEVGVTFYRQTVKEVVPVSSARAAELVKVFENTFRAVNIALVNELAMLCDRMELNVWEVLDAAFTKPFGILPFYPGPGVGGHCIPVDPHYLEWKAKELNFNTHFIALAGEINRRMPEFVKQKALRILNRLGIAASRATILVLGVAYKRDIADARESPAIELIRLLKREGARVLYHDDLILGFRDGDLEMASTPLTAEVLRQSDLVIIATDHSHVDYNWVVQQARHVLDTRNATRHVTANGERITLLMRVGVIGAGNWGQNLVRTFFGLGALAGVAEINQEIRERLAAEYPGIPIYENHDCLLESDVPAVVVATPAPTHYEIGKEALLAGKDVFVEKPLAVRFRELLEFAG